MNFLNSVRTPAWVAGLVLPTITCESCRRSTSLRNHSIHKAGIRMREGWYCSSGCFTSAAQTKLMELLPTRFENRDHVVRMPLGLSLIRRGVLTQAQFIEMTGRQRETGDEIGDVLVRSGTLSEKTITEARAHLWNCPVFAVPKHVSQTEIRIPSSLLNLYSAIPLHYVAATKLLLVGFVYGVEYALLYAIEQMTGARTQACFVTPSDFDTHIQQIARNRLEDSSSKVVNINSAQTPSEMAHTLCRFSIDFEADKVQIVRCQEHVWARLNCDSKNLDVLFKVG